MRARAALLLLVALALPASARAAGSSPSLARQGSHLYGEYCLACHGMNGEGVSRSTPNRIGYGPGRMVAQQAAVAPPLRGVGALAADFYLRTGYMPLPQVGIQPRRSMVLFSNRQIEALTAYVASLAPGPAIPKPHPSKGNISQGMSLFTTHCAGCHQVVAQGGYVTGAVPPSLEDDSPVQIAEAVRIGPYVMPKFSKKSLSDAQLDSIIRYVDYTKHADDLGGWSLGTVGPLPEGLVTGFIAMPFLIGCCILIGKRFSQ